ncbi:MAG: hypothetical protein ACM3X6_10600 [Patescibacteria group bacterium]
MFWRVFLGFLLVLLGGAAGFWLVILVKPKPFWLLLLTVPAMALIPADAAAGLVLGAWAAAAFYIRAHEGVAAPNESPGWRRIALDSLAAVVAFLAGLIYMIRQRGHGMAGIVLAIGVALAMGQILCYFRATAGDIPRELRIKHGYAVGFFSFLPWAYLLSSQGPIVFFLGFLTFFLIPPFFLAAVDFRLAKPAKKRRRPRARVAYRLPGR